MFLTRFVVEEIKKEEFHVYQYFPGNGKRLIIRLNNKKAAELFASRKNKEELEILNLFRPFQY